MTAECMNWEEENEEGRASQEEVVMIKLCLVEDLRQLM
jgi:hypothetical protein